MAPQYKLTYFNARGLAEPIRLLLAHANIELEDVRIEGSGWAQIKSNTPWGKVPLLEEGDFKLSQSVAILKYLATKHGYVGETIEETARMDEYIGAVNDLREVIMSYHWEKDPEKKEEKGVKLEEEIFPFYLAKFENIIKNNGNKFLVGKKVSYADFYVAANIQTSVIIKPELLDKFPSIDGHQTLILRLPGVKEWVEKRPVTPF